MPKRNGPSTHIMLNNQRKIDELEYFLESIAVALFGPQGEDFRKLRDYLPSGANLSLLIDAAKAAEGKDIAEDFQFVLADLTKRLARNPASGVPEHEPGHGLFSFLAYLDLLDRPLLLVDRIEPRHAAEVREAFAREPLYVEASLARIHAYAWLEFVGLADLDVEFDTTADRRLDLDPPGDRTVRGLEAIFATMQPPPTESLRRFLTKAHYLFALEYREQVQRLATPH